MNGREKKQQNSVKKKSIEYSLFYNDITKTLTLITEIYPDICYNQGSFLDFQKLNGISHSNFLPEILLTTILGPESFFNKTMKIKLAMTSLHRNLVMAKPVVNI